MRERLGWIGSIILAGAVLSAIGFPGTSARADDKSAALYKQKCAACHGVDGKGDTPVGKSMKVRSFADPGVAKMSDDELASVIEKGRNKMPGYAKSLKPEQVKDLVAYVRSLAK